jgi:flagellin FlaB
MVKNMKNEMKNENRDNVAAIGIGAMIVFIALILVAAVAAAVIIQTAEKLQQNAQTAGQDTQDSMSARVVILGVIISDAAANELDITFELAPGSDDVPTTDIEWIIVCDDIDDDALTAANTHKIGGANGETTIEAGNTYATTIVATNCAPTANEDHTLLVVAGSGGQTYEVLNYGGDVTDGAVVI